MEENRHKGPEDPYWPDDWEPLTLEADCDPNAKSKGEGKDGRDGIEDSKVKGIACSNHWVLEVQVRDDDPKRIRLVNVETKSVQGEVRGVGIRTCLPHRLQARTGQGGRGSTYLGLQIRKNS